MLTRHRSAWRRRTQRSRAARIAVPIAIPVALGLALGVALAANSGPSKTTINQAANNARFHRGRPPVASPSPTASATATPPAAAANVSCDLVVPANPLSAQGLATPWQLTGVNMTPAASGCNMANAANLGAFVQATILDPATGALSVYNPLVITQGTTAAAAPVVPTLPAGAVVTIDVGFNGTNLTLVNSGAGRRFGGFRRGGGGSLAQGVCVNGSAGSIFGQVSFCNGVAFFQAANSAIAAGTLKIPALGTANDGQACPTTRSFSVVDQDQSDNVTSQYLLTANGQTAQSNAANTAALAGATPINNGSDNLLLNHFLDPALGCTSFTAPDLSNPGQPSSSQALDELFANANQAAPIALVPLNDPMTQVNGAASTQKANLYRASVGQPAIGGNAASDTEAAYCQSLFTGATSQVASLQRDQANFANQASVMPAAATNLFTFLAMRLAQSYTNLNCVANGVAANPVNLTADGNGVVTAATFTAPGAAPAPSASPSAAPTGTATPAPSASASAGPTPAPTPSPTRRRRFG